MAARKVAGMNAKVITRSTSSFVSVQDSTSSTRAGVVVAIGGSEYPLVSIPQCRTCQSPLREELERCLTKGLSETRTLERVSQDHIPEGQRVSYQSLNHHARNHMRHSVATSRVIAEAWANKLGVDVEQEDTIVTHMGLIGAVAQRAFEGIADGTVEVDAKDGIAAAKLMLEFEGRINAGKTDSGAYLDALTAYLQVARSVLTPEQLVAFGDQLSSHPILREMMESSAPAAPELDVLDADAWEDDDDDEDMDSSIES